MRCLAELRVLVWFERVLFGYSVDAATGHTPIRLQRWGGGGDRREAIFNEDHGP